MPSEYRIDLFTIKSAIYLGIGFLLYNQFAILVFLAVIGDPSEFFIEYTFLFIGTLTIAIVSLGRFYVLAGWMQGLLPSSSFAIILIASLAGVSYTVVMQGRLNLIFVYAGLTGLALSMLFLILKRSSLVSRGATIPEPRSADIPNSVYYVWKELFAILGPVRARQVLEFEARADGLLRRSTFVLYTIHWRSNLCCSIHHFCRLRRRTRARIREM